MLDDLPQSPSAGTQPPELSHEDELRAYRLMLLIRRFEEKAGKLYGMGQIGGFCHLYPQYPSWSPGSSTLRIPIAWMP